MALRTLTLTSRVFRRSGFRVYSAATSDDGAYDLRREMSRRTANADTLFDLIDKDDNDKIDRREFNAAMREIGLENLNVLQRSLARSELSATTARDAALSVPYDDEHPDEAQVKPLGTLLMDRFSITVEVMVSKIFPAGFGWQYASCIADAQFGLAADSMGFFLMTGFGDGVGVFIGHSLYYAIKSAVYDPAIDIKAQVETGVLLGSAAFCSGSVWQPVVDTLTASGMGFTQVAMGTTVLCGAAFYTGLRLGRLVYGSMLGFSGVEENNYGNLKADGLLSLSIGGATGAFVGTDVSFGDANWLRPVVGIEEGVADLAGSVTAGSSTALGFLVFQSAQNVTEKQGKNWVD